jgi:hypothetical protein
MLQAQVDAMQEQFRMREQQAEQQEAQSRQQPSTSRRAAQADSSAAARPEAASRGGVPARPRTTPQAQAQHCYSCGKVAAEGKRLSRCSRCQVAQYCDAACQRAHWKKHKPLCCQVAPV